MFCARSGTGLASNDWIMLQILFWKVICRLSFIGIIVLSTSPAVVFGHGDEDHGEQKTKTTSNEKGTVSHSTRLGDFELMIKHPVLEPDTATFARLFITKFDSNEPVGNVPAVIEIESANGIISTTTMAASDQPGMYNVSIPALPQGNYVLRTKLSYEGETDTATFSGVEVNTPISSSGGETSWFRSAALALIFGFVVILLGGLVYFVWRFAGSESLNEEAVSA